MTEREKQALLTVKNLSVTFGEGGKATHAVDDISFSVDKGETVAVVGESGSGKSVTALSVMQLLPYPFAHHSQQSSITFKDKELVGAPEAVMQKIRGRQIGMIFQEPLTALNPLHTIEKQIGEVLFVHQGMSGTKAKERVYELMDLVGLPKLKDRLHAYPHELSGGQRQRVMIAMALANNPDLLIADEPTTALDVTVQAQILELLDDLKDRLGMGLLLITHDLSIVERMADKVCVMQHGKLVEARETKQLMASPKHDYTKMLLAAQPSGDAVPANQNAPTLIRAENLKIWFPAKKTFWGGTSEHVKAVDDISFSVRQGQTLGVVGESGSGKSTLGFGLLRLVKLTGGQVIFDGDDISRLDRKQMRPYRARMQIVFQDPFGSLSPRLSINDIIAEGLLVHHPDLSKSDREKRVIQALNDVRLDPDSRFRYPHEFSGGQRQRISIARALVLQPELLVLDEPTSALDVSVQAQIVDLLRDLQTKYNLTYLFISHDLRVVRALAHDLIVMKDGKIVEEGPAENVFDRPEKDYTKALMTAALELKTA